VAGIYWVLIGVCLLHSSAVECDKKLNKFIAHKKHILKPQNSSTCYSSCEPSCCTHAMAIYGIFHSISFTVIYLFI